MKDAPNLADRSTAAGPLGFLLRAERSTEAFAALLVVDHQGTPQEFVHSDAVEVTSLMRVLHGAQLPAHLLTAVFASPLLGALKTRPAVLLTREPALLLKKEVACAGVPLVVLAPPASPVKESIWTARSLDGADGISNVCWSGKSVVDQVSSILATAVSEMAPLPLEEPFGRLERAIKEVEDEIWSS